MDLLGTPSVYDSRNRPRSLYSLGPWGHEVMSELAKRHGDHEHAPDAEHMWLRNLGRFSVARSSVVQQSYPRPLERLSEYSEASFSNAKKDVPGNALKLSGWRLSLTLPSILICILLAGMDSSIVSTALVTIGNDFSNFSQTTWIILGYLLSYMAFAMLWSRLSDVFGRKPIFLVSLVCLLVFSVGCGAATTLNTLIVFRVLQGLGGSGLYSLGTIVLPEITPGQWYAHMVAAQGGIFTLANVLGPVLGGVISATTTWRWLFYLNIPGCGILIPILIIAWSDNQDRGDLHTRIVNALNFDFIGLLLLTATACCLVVGIQLGGSYYAPWTSSQVVGCLLGALSAFAALLIWNWYRHRVWYRSKVAPLFPRRLMKIRLVSAAFVICTLSGFNLFVAITSIPQRFQVINGDSALVAGVRLLPFLAFSAIGATICGQISSRRNWQFQICMVCSSLLLLGSGLLSIRPKPGPVPLQIYFFQVLYGLGTGGLLSSTGYLAGLNCNYEDYALAAGIIGQSRILGGCIGLTLSTLVLNATFSTQLTSALQPEELDNLRQSLDYTTHLAPSQQTAAGNAFANAFCAQFYMATGVAAVALIVSLATYTRHPIDLKKRLEFADKWKNGEITLDQANKLSRGQMTDFRSV